MSRMKIMLAGLLAMLVVGSVASATASAAPDGPWFRHPVGTEQVKWLQNEEKEVEGKNQGNFVLRFKAIGITTTIKCGTAISPGLVWNGLHQGKDEFKLEFTKCFTVQPCAGTGVEISNTEIYSELQWKYAGKQSELNEQPPKQQKIFDVFAPKKAPEQKTLEKGEKIARVIWFEITFPEACKIVVGKFAVEAAGTVAIFEDQHQVTHKIIWGTAAQVDPQNQDSKEATLHWQFPNPTEFHHQGVQTKAQLLFAGNPAELEGTIHIKRSGVGAPEEFGTFNE